MDNRDHRRETPIDVRPTPALSHRDRAILRAVAGGSAQLMVGVEPDLFLDGRCCSDQVAVHRLARAGLIVAAARAAVGERVPAALSPAGRQELVAT
ncbi:MAG: hypothetical protein LH603_22700 [Pseudonocardia sp.]|nr:hypothetical protein [Pseudonocardia sp.]